MYTIYEVFVIAVSVVYNPAHVLLLDDTNRIAKSISVMPVLLIYGLSITFVSELPYNDYFEYYGPDFKLHISPSNMANQNTTEYMEKIK